MASETQICNMALARLGADPITALTDATEQGRACNLVYEHERDALQESYPWNFCIERTGQYSADATTPNSTWSYRYALPADMLRFLKVTATGSTNTTYEPNWVIENGWLMTDDPGPLKYKYIKKVTLTGRFSATFVKALALKIASEIAYRLTGSVNLQQSLYAEYLRAIAHSYRVGAIEDNSGETIPESSWQTEGR